MKILYGVASEGMGHAIRSKPIIEHLSKNNEVLVLTDRKAYNLLSKNFNTKKIENFYLVYNKEKVNFILTILYNTIRSPKIILKNSKIILNVIKNFKPDIVISDFDPITSYYGFISRKPLIYINNQHISKNTKVIKPGNFLSRLLSNSIIALFSPSADYYLITTFFYPETRNNKTFLFPPILRKEILEAKSKKGKHILVYLRKNDGSVIKLLRGLDKKFIVYGLDKEFKERNITSKNFSEKEFIKDLESCKGVIANGGFTFLSEALYLHKPILTVPFEKQYEQILNAVYIKKLEYGEHTKKLTKEEITNFIKNIKLYNRRLKEYKREDNSKIIKKLDEIIETYKKKSINI